MFTAFTQVDIGAGYAMAQASADTRACSSLRFFVGIQLSEPDGFPGNAP